MNKKEEIFKMSKDIDWPTAVSELDRVVDLQASRVVSDGKYSREAHRSAWKIRAAWERIKRG